MGAIKALQTELQELVRIHGLAAVLMVSAEVLKCHCLKCGNKWAPRNGRIPAQCPACKNTNWQTAKGEWVMTCKHENIMVYEETSYRGELINGVVHFDPNKVFNISDRTAICTDCDKVFEEIDCDGDYGEGE